MTPLRIQLRRVKGWRMPPNTVHCARPGMWGNRWKIGGWSNILVRRIRYSCRSWARQEVFSPSLVDLRDRAQRAAKSRFALRRVLMEAAL